jgi:hypothetical protein
VPLPWDTWLVGETLVGPTLTVPARKVAELGAQRIAAFYQALRSSNPREAVRLAWQPRASADQFRAAVTASMQSAAGRSFARECWRARDADGQRAAAEHYLAEARQGQHFMLLEVMLAEMILCERPGR